jgi:hypothetical protein
MYTSAGLQLNILQPFLFLFFLGHSFHDWMERLMSEYNQEESPESIGSTRPITLVVSNELKGNQTHFDFG